MYDFLQSDVQTLSSNLYQLSERTRTVPPSSLGAIGVGTSIVSRAVFVFQCLDLYGSTICSRLCWNLYNFSVDFHLMQMTHKFTSLPAVRSGQTWIKNNFPSDKISILLRDSSTYTPSCNHAVISSQISIFSSSQGKRLVLGSVFLYPLHISNISCLNSHTHSPFSNLRGGRDVPVWLSLHHQTHYMEMCRPDSNMWYSVIIPSACHIIPFCQFLKTKQFFM